MLSNVYLHEVLDCWFERTVRPRVRGRAFLIRYADDVVMVFSLEADARRVMKVLPERFGRYGLTLHPEKTRLIDFRRPDQDDGPRRRTFDLLGFTYFWGRSRKGNWVVRQKTASNRFSRAVKAIAQWCRDHRHLPIAEQHAALVKKLRGHFGYYGITGNAKGIASFRHAALRAWLKWLQRRSQRAHTTGRWIERLLERYPLPSAIAVHSVLRHAANP